MPPKDFDISKIRFGTYDGEEIGELGEISTITVEELREASEEYIGVFDNTAYTFTGQFKLESNNGRKMKGKPLLRGKTNFRRFWRNLKKACRRK